MHPEQYAKQRAAGYGAGAFDCSTSLGLAGEPHHIGTISKGPELSALEQIAGRVSQLAARVYDTNSNTSAFVSRLVGYSAPKASEAMNGNTEKDRPPTLQVISSLLDLLEIRIYTAEELSRELARIG